MCLKPIPAFQQSPDNPTNYDAAFLVLDYALFCILRKKLTSTLCDYFRETALAHPLVLVMNGDHET